jgi:hypothetical protein
MAYVKKGGHGGRRPGAGSKRGVPQRRRNRAAAVAERMAGLSDTDRDKLAGALDLGPLGETAKRRLADLLETPTMPGGKLLLEAVQHVMTPPRRTAAPSTSHGPQQPPRRTFTVVAAPVDAAK